jgi:hypothetical protein
MIVLIFLSTFVKQINAVSSASLSIRQSKKLKKLLEVTPFIP